MSAETKEFGPEARGGPERTPLSEAPATGDPESPTPPGQDSAWNYFTDSVPLRGDRDLREREERIGRLERGRPRRRRRVPRMRAGLLAVVVVGCAAIGLSVLGRSPAPTDRARRPAAHPVPDVPRVATATPRVGLAPAVVVERARPRRSGSSSARSRRRPRRQRPVGPGPDEAPATDAAAPPEADEPEAQVEAPPEAEPATPAPEAEPEAPASAAPEPQSEPKSSSSSEANRQFGFGR